MRGDPSEYFSESRMFEHGGVDVGLALPALARTLWITLPPLCSGEDLQTSVHVRKWLFTVIIFFVALNCENVYVR